MEEDFIRFALPPPLCGTPAPGDGTPRRLLHRHRQVVHALRVARGSEGRQALRRAGGVARVRPVWREWRGGPTLVPHKVSDRESRTCCVFKPSSLLGDVD